jgi:hypothetical protein
MSLTEEEKKELEMLKNRFSEMDAIASDSGSRMDSIGNDPTKEERISNYPGFTAGAYLGQKLVPPLGHPIANFAGKGLAGLVGGLAGSEITGPMVKPYADKIYNALSASQAQTPIALGDDFNQGMGTSGQSIIDNTLVPYETIDSSSTGVLR